MIFFFGPYVLLSDLCLDHRTMFERTLRVQGYADRSQLDQFSMEFRNSPSMFVRALLKKGYRIGWFRRHEDLLKRIHGYVAFSSPICGDWWSRSMYWVELEVGVSYRRRKSGQLLFASPILRRLLFTDLTPVADHAWRPCSFYDSSCHAIQVGNTTTVFLRARDAMGRYHQRDSCTDTRVAKSSFDAAAQRDL